MEATVSEPAVPAAVGLAAAIGELDAPQDSPLDPGNAFLAEFNKLPAAGSEETPPAEKSSKLDKAAAPAEEENAGDVETGESEESSEEDPHGDEAPDPKDDKANEKWKGIKSDLKKTRAELRAEREKMAAEVTARDQKIQEFEAAKLDLERQIAELAEAREKAARVDEIEKELSIHKVESSDHYRKAVTEPLNAIETRLEEMAKSSEIDLNDLLDAVGEGDPAKQRAMLKEILPSLDEVDKLSLARMVEDTRSILGKRDQIRSDAANARKELEQRQTAESAKAKELSRKEFGAAVEHAAGELKKRFPHVELEKGETADGVFAAMMEKAKETDFDAASAGTKAFAALSGIALVRATKALQHQNNKIKTLEARLAELTAAEPKVEGSESAPQAKETDFLSAMGISPSTSAFIQGG